MCFFLYTPQTQTLDLRISDLIGISNKVPASGDVVIVELDSKAIENAGAFPIPHSYIADLLEKLDNAGAKKFYLDQRLAIATNKSNYTRFSQILKQIKPSRIAVAGYNPTHSQEASYPLPEYRKYVSVVGANYFPDVDTRYRILNTTASKQPVHYNPARWLYGEDSFDAVRISRKIDASSLVRVSAANVAADKMGAFQDKIILIGLPNSVTTSGLVYIDGVGIDRVGLVALAVETLIADMEPSDLNKSTKILIAFLIFLIVFWVRSKLKKNESQRKISRLFKVFMFNVLSIGGITGLGIFFYFNYEIQPNIIFYATAFGVATVLFTLKNLRVVEVISEVYSGDLSTEEAWAWQSVHKQREPLILLGFSNIKRLNEVALDFGFFASDNPHKNENEEIIKSILGMDTVSPVVELRSVNKVSKVRCVQPYPGVPIVRIDDWSLEEEKREELEFALSHDALTRCLNREGLIKIANDLSKTYSIIMMDLNGFKAVNDTYGHAAGDKILKLVTSKFSKVLCTSSHLARLGGDEFCVLSSSAVENESAQNLCKKLEGVIGNQINIDNTEIEVSVSAGYSISNDLDSLSETMDKADKAMYERKNEIKSKRNNAAIFDVAV